MVDRWVIFNLENHIHGGDHETWVFDMSIQGNQDFKRMVIPADTHEWRAAEYDIDISTQAGLLSVWDIILHEPFMKPVMSVPVIKGVASVTAQQQVHLFNAPSKAAARSAHLQRVADVKSTTAQVVWGANAVYGDTVNRDVTKPFVVPHQLSEQPAGTIHPMFARVLGAPINSDRVEARRKQVNQMRVDLGLEPDPNPPVVTRVDPQYMDQSIKYRNQLLGN